MNLSIEDLEAIKAIVREVVREELGKAERRHEVKIMPGRAKPIEPAEIKHEEQRPQEVVAHIRRTSAA